MITRIELYERVWREPMTKVASEFGVSASYLARICSRLNVPRPNRGYWARIEAGQHTRKAGLPEAQPGDELTWHPGGGAPEVQGPVGTKTNAFSSTKKNTRRTAATGQHELVANARPLFLASRFSREGNFLKPAKRNLLDLVVTTDTLGSALALADGLFAAFTRKGHRVILAGLGESGSRQDVDTRDVPTKQASFNNLWSPGRKTVLYVNGTPIGLTIFEITEATPMRYSGNGEYVKEKDFVMPKGLHWEQFHWRSIKDIPSGRLCLQAYASYYDNKWSRQWKELRPGDFAKRIVALAKEVMACEVEASKAISKGKQRAEEKRVQWEAQKEQWRIEELELKQSKAVQECKDELEALLAKSEHWARLDRFFEAMTKHADNASDESKARLTMLIDTVKSIEGDRPTLEDFLAWRVPHERV
jgi:hypothetical protein